MDNIEIKDGDLLKAPEAHSSLTPEEACRLWDWKFINS